MKFVTSDQITLDYTDIGEGQPMLFIAGFGAAKEIWHAQAAFFEAHHYRVIQLDVRNQGMAQHTVKGLRMSRMALDLAEVITKLGLAKPILVGNSMGAACIWAYMSLYGDRDLDKVVIVDQSPKMIADETWSFGFKDLTWDSFPLQLRLDFGKATYRAIDTDTADVVAQVKQQSPFDRQLDLPLLVDHAFQDWRDVIRQSMRPYLVIAGEKSPFFNPAFAPIVAQMGADGHAQVIEEAGHIVMAEQSALFNQIVLAFIKA
ncbi:alpha/beta hydrolase [Latilactobacillus curvatus]|uniref:alpha/beta fold hydrolase n=1 Tax=Latilactobacillus curvatus TaxID=28038 RepID=UPI0020C76F37|nr:alpha/beta hydrolase [Latilactobacillus curvatus]MCP8861211.1 alpha/beta hydrolase [Latilactobacillus curvatus]MCP8867937.1 alpha/beta hydrolase [Latilactobacillus curvatus]MCP8871478.1 alpha/beta hydrolase [Latilactobacillus curvatus]MCP8880504.1 alpha/beta hydrolase [Latilactobacillus curvatus]WBY48330.1 alpha/beta hydrolase [Latilactobacillus curvatus]